MPQIKTVTVVGANGTMGRNVAAIFASFGNAKVYMVCREREKAESARIRAAKSVRADSICRNLFAADYTELAECVAQSDLVFESVSENMEIKRAVTSKIAQSLRPDAFACSGTSGLSVNALSECFPAHLRGRYFGVHMFNPPYSMTLCEFIETRDSDADAASFLKTYLRDVLLRTVVEVRDAPAFLANRIGFQFINEAMQYAERYKDNGGVDYIDAILGSFTGRTMPPLMTSDFVGLDVHKAIVDNIYRNTSDYARETFVLPEFAHELIREGRLGRKTGGGLYRTEVYENGLKRHTVYDIATGKYRDKLPFVFPFAVEMKKCLRVGDYAQAMAALIHNRSQEAEICLHFLLSYILYALHTAQEVGFDISAADDVMATGFNWCPPLAMAQAIGTAADLKELVKTRFQDSLPASFDAERLLDAVVSSGYDYRMYFKSGR